MAATRLRVCRNSGETQEIKTAGWFMECYFPSIPGLSSLLWHGKA